MVRNIFQITKNVLFIGIPCLLIVREAHSSNSLLEQFSDDAILPFKRSTYLNKNAINQYVQELIDLSQEKFCSENLTKAMTVNRLILVSKVKTFLRDLTNADLLFYLDITALMERINDVWLFNENDEAISVVGSSRQFTKKISTFYGALDKFIEKYTCNPHMSINPALASGTLVLLYIEKSIIAQKFSQHVLY